MNRSDKMSCVVVDGYPFSVPLARMIGERGYHAINVQSGARKLLGGEAFRSSCAATLLFDGDLGRLVSELAPWNVVAVMPGSQPGTLLADRLAEALDLPGNGTKQSLDRIDKYAMSRVLGSAGLRCAKTHATAHEDEMVAWFRRLGASRVVVKPCTSMGTDDVTVCCDEAEVRAAFTKILHKTNRSGLRNDAVVIQEFLEGTEYVVNTVSFKGMHRVTDIWRCHKTAANGSSFVYQKIELLPSSAAGLTEMIDYTLRMLDAFGVKEGPAHNEVMMTSAGPVLIEINPRASGANLPRMATLAIGEGQFEWMVRALLERDGTPAGFHEPYEMRRHAMSCLLVSRARGRFAGLRFKDEIEALPSFQFAHYPLAIGDEIRLTVDLFTVPGTVYLAHADRAALERDYARIRELERDGLFLVAS